MIKIEKSMNFDILIYFFKHNSIIIFVLFYFLWNQL